MSSSVSSRFGITARIFLAAFAGAALLAALAVLSAAPPDKYKVHVDALADPALAGRRAGKPGAERAAKYVEEQFRLAGFNVRMQEFSDNRRNVVARYGAADRHILIGAHYDGQEGLPSASDNAAGVAMVIELGRELKAANLPVSLVLVAFDDEEQGLNGSAFYAENPIFPLEQLMTAVIFDTMGRSFMDLRETTLFTLGTENSPVLGDIVAKRNRKGMLVAGTDLIGPRSDFAPFAARRIPYLFFSHATHKDYHGPNDRPDLLNYAKIASDGELIEDVIRDIAKLPAKPGYVDDPVYPASEIAVLAKLMDDARAEKADLPECYRLVFEDMEERVRTDKSRQTIQVAASAMLGLATPRFSPFMLELIVAPFYEKAKRPDIVKALLEESARWH